VREDASIVAVQFSPHQLGDAITPRPLMFPQLLGTTYVAAAASVMFDSTTTASAVVSPAAAPAAG
jgi:hypothetical protein